MINSLTTYREALAFAKNNPTADAVPTLKNFYLQMMTMTFYELTTRKTSPLLSALCQVNQVNLPTKNFALMPSKASFNQLTGFDLLVIVYGLNIALSENLDSCMKFFDSNAENIFRGVPLNAELYQNVLAQLTALDGNLGRFFGVKVIEVPVEKNSSVLEAEEKELLLGLDTLANNRRADDEKILTEIKKVQLSLQDELPRLQESLKKISEIRDGVEYKMLTEPIYQLLQLYDTMSETAGQHPQADIQRGYEKLVRRCKNFPSYVEQSLEMLGAELINETDVPLDASRHKVVNAVRPSKDAKVSKILSVGLIYKDQVWRKAEVEIVEPVSSQPTVGKFGSFSWR
ncbi:MAG: hypothetical protein IKO05_04145 [Selenomonadaceae bacterium]|nr:hypothetical protein [Selenomonadaceae bacterium]